MPAIEEEASKKKLKSDLGFGGVPSLVDDANILKNLSSKILFFLYLLFLLL